MAGHAIRVTKVDGSPPPSICAYVARALCSQVQQLHRPRMSALRRRSTHYSIARVRPCAACVHSPFPKITAETHLIPTSSHRNCAKLNKRSASIQAHEHTLSQKRSAALVMTASGAALAALGEKRAALCCGPCLSPRPAARACRPCLSPVPPWLPPVPASHGLQRGL